MTSGPLREKGAAFVYTGVLRPWPQRHCILKLTTEKVVSGVTSTPNRALTA